MWGDTWDLGSLGSEEKNAIVECFRLLARWNTQEEERRRTSREAGESAVSVLGKDEAEG